MTSLLAKPARAQLPSCLAAWQHAVHTVQLARCAQLAPTLVVGLPTQPVSTPQAATALLLCAFLDSPWHTPSAALTLPSLIHDLPFAAAKPPHTPRPTMQLCVTVCACPVFACVPSPPSPPRVSTATPLLLL